MVDRDMGERHVDPFRGNIDTLVDEDNRLWCQTNPEKWLHEKFGGGTAYAIKRVPDGKFVTVWVGSSSDSAGHLRYQTRFCYVVHYHLQCC